MAGGYFGDEGRAPAPAGQSRRFGRRALVGGVVGVAIPVLARVGGTRTFARSAATVAQGTPRAEWLGRLEVVREQRPTYQEAPTDGGQLRLALPRPGAGGDVASFSPVAYRQSAQVLTGLLDPLVWVDDVTLEPRPWLAERWEWSDEGRVVTYALRRDVMWHDGRPLTAEDVRFSMIVARDDIDSGVRNLFVAMHDIVVVDDYTVRVALSEPDGGWLFNASSQFVCQQAQYVEHWEGRPAGERTLSDYDWRSNPPVGTGPWRVSDWDEDAAAFARNEGYWAGAAHFESMSIAWEDDATARLDAWTERTADIVWPVDSSSVADVTNGDGRLHVVDAASVMFAAFNFDHPVRRAERSRRASDLFADVRVRRALSLAIDRDRYAREVFGGFARVERAGTIAQGWANDPSVVNPPRDAPAALSLLREAGWADRDESGVLENEAGFTFEITAIVRDDARPELRLVLEHVVEDLGEIGVRVDLQALAADEFQDRWVVRRDFDLIAYAYDLYPGFTDFDLYGSGWDIRVNPRGWNPGGYRNQTVDQAIADALAAVDIAAQREALGRLQRAADEDLFALWLGFPQELVLVRDDVLGFQPHALVPTWNTRTLWRRTVQSDGTAADAVGP